MPQQLADHPLTVGLEAQQLLHELLKLPGRHDVVQAGVAMGLGVVNLAGHLTGQFRDTAGDLEIHHIPLDHLHHLLRGDPVVQGHRLQRLQKGRHFGFNLLHQPLALKAL